MKKFLIFLSIMITTNVFANCDETARQTIKNNCINGNSGISNIANDETNIWFCTDTINDLKAIKIYVCEKDIKSEVYKLSRLTENSTYQKTNFDKIFQIMFYEESQSKIGSFAPKTQTLYVGKSPTEAPGLLEAANPMVANKIYNRKDGRIHIDDKNNTASHTDSETPATEEEIAIYTKVIEELNKQIQQIEDCVNDINVKGII